MPYFSRREILVGMGAVGLTPLLLSGCDGSSDDFPALPDDLPIYEWNGPVGPQTLFEHGVASGDPLTDSMIIWTRVTPGTSASSEPIEVFWEMALDEDFQQRAAASTTMTDAARDFTVKVDVQDLVWGRNYYYRFALEGRWSSTGRTRLAPSGNHATQLRFGVCACSSYARGWFHAYRHMAARADLDAVLHLGDYLYEYGDGELTTPPPVFRLVEPSHETVTLDDYRLRYSQYRRDRDCQECHRQHPFIVVWDDHESANDSWMGGAENHDPETEGSWEDRLTAARQAFFEWIPIRENSTQQLYRAFNYGDLADIIMLDTRIEGRQEQSDAWVCTWGAQELPNQVLGSDQEQWLFDELSKSTAKWRILGNQVVMSRWQLALDPPTHFNKDQWNCYPAARDRLISFLRDDRITNVVVATGDVHSSWAMDVTDANDSYNPETHEGAVAVEFVAPGITAPNPFPLDVLESVISASPHIRYAELTRKGYLVLDVQTDKVQSDWYLLDGVNQNEGNELHDASWAVRDGEPRVVEMSGPERSNEEPPPLAS